MLNLVSGSTPCHDEEEEEEEDDDEGEETRIRWFGGLSPVAPAPHRCRIFVRLASTRSLPFPKDEEDEDDEDEEDDDDDIPWVRVSSKTKDLASPP